MRSGLCERPSTLEGDVAAWSSESYSNDVSEPVAYIELWVLRGWIELVTTQINKESFLGYAKQRPYLALLEFDCKLFEQLRGFQGGVSRLILERVHRPIPTP